jgi:hypothetical protein
MIARIPGAYTEVLCAKCGMASRLTVDHVARLQAAGIPWTCTGFGCAMLRTPKHQPTKKETVK